MCSSRQLLLCRVALGKSFLQFSAMKMAHAPPGHHSVVGRWGSAPAPAPVQADVQADTPIARPSVGGLSFPEYVIYRGEQVRLTQSQVPVPTYPLQAYPEYLITYLIQQPDPGAEPDLPVSP